LHFNLLKSLRHFKLLSDFSDGILGCHIMLIYVIIWYVNEMLVKFKTTSHSFNWNMENHPS
jgi:hypothetical protein